MSSQSFHTLLDSFDIRTASSDLNLQEYFCCILDSNKTPKLIKPITKL